MVAVFTAGATRATGYLVPASVWNAYLGGNGSIDFLGIKELWVPVTAWENNAGPQALDVSDNVAKAVLSAVDMSAIMCFRCPYDFASIVEAKVVVWPTATQASANYDIMTTYAKLTETWNTHAVNDTASTYNVTANKIFEVNVATPLASMSAGDIVNMIIVQGSAGHNVNVFGFYLKYQVG